MVVEGGVGEAEISIERVAKRVKEMKEGITVQRRRDGMEYCEEEGSEVVERKDFLLNFSFFSFLLFLNWDLSHGI